MKRLFSHTKTKIVLADYLAQKTIAAGRQNRGRVLVVGGQNAWEQEKIFSAPKQTRGSRHGDYFTCHGYYSQSYDMILTQRFLSLPSDIILLSLCKNTPFVTGRNHWKIILRSFFRTIGLEKATTLPVLKGADNTDCCRVKGKPHAGKLSWKLKSLSVFLNLEVQVWFPGLRLRLQSRDLCVSFISLRQKYVLWQNWDDCFLGRKKLSRRGCHRTKLLFKKQSKESIINFYCAIKMW